jgi:phenylalanyl-tRNA synthetase beta subunit
MYIGKIKLTNEWESVETLAAAQGVSLTFGSNSKTLTDEEVNPVMKKVIEALEKNLKAELRK